MRVGSIAPVPLLVTEPSASLWRLIADGPVSEAELCAMAEGLVADESREFVQAALSAFSEAQIVVAV